MKIELNKDNTKVRISNLNKEQWYAIQGQLQYAIEFNLELNYESIALANLLILFKSKFDRLSLPSKHEDGYRFVMELPQAMAMGKLFPFHTKNEYEHYFMSELVMSLKDKFNRSNNFYISDNEKSEQTIKLLK
ncbi:hypothetical protein V9L05_20455 [Bernardetia sp. Wsw4-3y2]|uniref:hypothetical protein n=1 Tax=Bernardetia sp. Wsw4-3y2 TaxID=3127471 RepID=UPI0030CC5379